MNARNLPPEPSAKMPLVQVEGWFLQQGKRLLGILPMKQ